MYLWHKAIINEAQTTGKVVCPTGRWFPYKPYQKNGDWVWPVTTIKNYPVQGTGADLVCLARVEFFRRFKDSKIHGKMVSSVHDSIVCDVVPDAIPATARLLQESVEIVPQLFQEKWGIEFDLPMTAEILAGNNMKNMQEI